MRRRSALALGGLAVAAVWLIATAFLFVWPREDNVHRADALVVLGPGPHGERYRLAAQLLRRHVASALVVSEPRRLRPWKRLGTWCSEQRATCFRANPFTTRGEARQIGALARRHRWDSLLVVTSRYHVVRARLLIRRCFHGTVSVVGATPSKRPREVVSRTFHEWGGLLDALVRDRGC